MLKGADNERLKTKIFQLIKKKWLLLSYRKKYKFEFIKDQLVSAIRIYVIAAMQL